MPAQRNPIWNAVGCALRLIVTAISLLLCATAAVHAQGGSIYGQAVSPAGYPVAFASVRICPTTSTGAPCTPLTPNVYADPGQTIPVANPYTTDGFGNYSVFVPAGNYYIVQVSFTSNQQPYTYAYIVAAASSSVAVSAPQYSIATYTAPGTATTLGESGVTAPNGQLRTDAAGGLYVPGPAIFYGSLTGTVLNATLSPYYEVNGTQIAAVNLLNGVTGSGTVVLANTPTLITPILGVAAATSLNTSGNIVDGGSLAVTGNATAPIFNAGTGFELGSAAPMNHVLLGNGTNYVDSSTIPASVISGLTLYYQTMQNNGSGLTQQPILSTDATLTMSNGSGKTALGMPSVGASGSFIIPNITVDAQGRVTAATSTVITNSLATNGYQYLPGGLILEWMTSATDFPNNGRIAATETWPLAFPHACFIAEAQPKFDSAITVGDFQGVSVYVTSGGCTTTNVSLYGEVRSDGNAESNYHAFLYAIGW